MSSALQFKSFFNSYSNQLSDCDCTCTQKDHQQIDKFQILPSQAIYVFDWKNRTISYQKGIHQLLGYTENEFDTSLLADYVHPEDAARYVQLVKITNEWARNLEPEPFSVEVIIDYRIRRKDGNYIKVMRQSTIYEVCKDRSPRSAFNLLTDISRIKRDNSVNLSVTSLSTGEVFLENQDPMQVFTKLSGREVEILDHLKKGSNSALIAEKLFISRHTVDTHRRNMLAKTSCKNVMELVQKATHMGII